MCETEVRHFNEGFHYIFHVTQCFLMNNTVNRYSGMTYMFVNNIINHSVLPSMSSVVTQIVLEISVRD
jgi:hypothetical protein